MNEKQIQEVMALVDNFGNAEHHQDDGQAVYFRNAIESALRERFSDEKQQAVPDESPGEGWDSFFEKRLPSLAREHPSLLVRQLAQRMLSAAPAQPAQAERCPNCDDTGHVHSIDGEWRGICYCPAGQKPAQAEQPPCGNTPYDEGPFTVAQVSQPKAAQQEPMFWVRLCSNGMYEGPIHNAQIEKVRKESGAWTPLYAAAPQREPMTDEQAWEGYTEWLRSSFEQEFTAGVRYAERFHHITKKEQQ